MIKVKDGVVFKAFPVEMLYLLFALHLVNDESFPEVDITIGSDHDYNINVYYRGDLTGSQVNTIRDKTLNFVPDDIRGFYKIEYCQERDIFCMEFDFRRYEKFEEG
jgi:hypothetical protein